VGMPTIRSDTGGAADRRFAVVQIHH